MEKPTPNQLHFAASTGHHIGQGCNNLIPNLSKNNKIEVVKIGIAILLVCLAIPVAIHWAERWRQIIYSIYFFQGNGQPYSQISLGVIWGLVSAFGLGLGVTAWQILLAVKYRPVDPCTDETCPTCTVVVPAFNEGKQVCDTLLSIAASDYPREKMQIIAVDDGSQDDTWNWMQAAAAMLGDRLTLVQLPTNCGKRQALYEGFTRSTGQILVTIDSDSLIGKSTLRHLLSPFVCDSKVGAVAGNVRVLNRDAGIIPRMLDVNFTYSFDFIRAAQSRLNTVVCTPGALSAYRAEVVFTVLDEWVNQRFMGRPASIGEDRAMTNLILRSGYHVTYQRDAVVRTMVPTKYNNLCKMLLRWARSNIRETIVMTSFLFTRFRSTSSWGARSNLVLSWYGLLMGEVFKLVGFAYLLCCPLIISSNMLMATVLAALLPALVYLFRHRNSDFLWSFPFTAFWVTALSWISLYALLTPHRSKWLTRKVSIPNLSNSRVQSF